MPGVADGISTFPAGRASLINWQSLVEDLDRDGWSILSSLLTPAECESLAALYDAGGAFRSRVIMERHGFGRGDYRYFAYPLPAVVQELRSGLYPNLAPIANGWNERMGLGVRFPDEHSEFLQRCHEAGQRRPTPLLLRYGPGDYNCLHCDLYGEHVFPLQAATLLSEPGADFTGGEFVLAEQRPRMQSRVAVVPLRKGDAVVFAVNQRPHRGVRGDYRVAMRHGVSGLRSGERLVLGLIFHDAA